VVRCGRCPQVRWRPVRQATVKHVAGPALRQASGRAVQRGHAVSVAVWVVRNNVRIRVRKGNLDS
jgi:hypothetical protein